VATIEVHIGPSFEGKNGRPTRTRRGWVAVGTNRENGREAFRYTAARRDEARLQAWQYCKRHGHGMLTPRSA
jgi:hypothetical protein